MKNNPSRNQRKRQETNQKWSSNVITSLPQPETKNILASQKQTNTLLSSQRTDAIRNYQSRFRFVHRGAIGYSL